MVWLKLLVPTLTAELVRSMLTMGEMPEKRSGLLSMMRYISSMSTLRARGPNTLTCKRFIPIEETLARILSVRPLPRPTMIITAMMPMMMPSMVSRVRNLLLAMFFSACRTVS